MRICMKVLIVTEKYNPSVDQRDGGANVVNTIKFFLKNSCHIMQFSQNDKRGTAEYHYSYPHKRNNRFERRLANRAFIGEKIQKISSKYEMVIYIHVSMQFGLEIFPLQKEIKIWTFPMFLTPSYRQSGERVSNKYFEAEKRALALSYGIVTPSPFEKRQLYNIYGISEKKIFMIPRGINSLFISKNNRYLSSALHFCSVGSIKPQKNTLKLIDLFNVFQKEFTGADLILIGPIQDFQYAEIVMKKIKELHLEKQIKVKGFIEPKQLPKELSKCHFHLSTSRCETFGRSIFETLALGIPNIVFQANHAAQDFLNNLPYIRFVHNQRTAIKNIKDIMKFYNTFSSMCEEIGELYSDDFLGSLLVATLLDKEAVGICDFDGTLFHKNDEQRTYRSLYAFQRFPLRIICTARPLSSLLSEITYYQLQVDWIIANSGAIIADGFGRIKKSIPLGKLELSYLKKKIKYVDTDKNRIQVAIPKDIAVNIPFLRKEIYQETAYYNHWKASKLNAICWLLKEITWKGRVVLYGDGKYDQEMITYFDGRWIRSSSSVMGEQKEVNYVGFYV